MNVPTSDTGMAMIGMIAARHVCRKMHDDQDDEDDGLDQRALHLVHRILDVFGRIVRDRIGDALGEVLRRSLQV